MISENNDKISMNKEENNNITINNLLTFSNLSSINNLNEDESIEIIELNNRIKNDFMSYCSSFLREDEETNQCVQIIWKKYLQYVGDIAMISAFFDTLPFHIKTLILPKYQNEIIQWYENLFHIHSNALLCSIYYSETFQRVIRYALKNSKKENNLLKKAIIYIPIDFDPNLKIELTSSLSNIKFEHIQNQISHEDIININQLEQFIQRDLNDIHSYPFMVIANAGTALLGHCDELTKIKNLCEQNDIWLHVIGDLLGSLSLLSPIKDNVNINCDSLTIDIIKLFGIQNLPYLTFFLRSTKEITETELNNNNNNSFLTSHPLYDLILHNPSISFLSVWSISQRCSKDNILSHMKQSFDISNLLITGLKQIKTLRILNNNNDDNEGNNTYKSICSGDAPNDLLPKSIVIFRFQPNDLLEVNNIDDLYNYIDLLNLWLFDKLSQQYPKMNFELLKSIHFQIIKFSNNHLNQIPAHAIRFAPLEHLLDNINSHDIKLFLDDIQHYNDILLATITARLNLSSIISKYDNLILIRLPNWAGIGAVRYIPTHINQLEMNETSLYEINTIQTELIRKLQINDSAFSLGGGINEHDSMFYLRLGMIRKHDDINILLEKISNLGKETETSLKYIEDMAEKIKIGIEKVQKDLQNENQQLLVQEGLLKQLPIVSNIISWWSPTPTTSALITKGRSFDLYSGQIESTENTYAYRMQIKKQSSYAPTDNENDITTINTEDTTNLIELKSNE